MPPADLDLEIFLPQQLLELDRQDIAVIVIYGVALGLLSLAVPIAVQSLVNTVAFGSLFQPLVMLGSSGSRSSLPPLLPAVTVTSSLNSVAQIV